MTIRLVMSTLYCVLWPSLAAAQATCADWNTSGFFKIATTQDVVRCMESGASLKARTEEGFTPLHWAAAHANAHSIQALLAAGANPKARTEEGYTPLHMAGVGKSPAVVIATLLDAGADLEAKAEGGWTPLHLAAEEGLSAGVRALLDAGANAKARTEKGKTPWEIARGNEALDGTDALWRLNDARFE